MEMDPATGCIYLEDLGVDRHHLIVRNTHSILPSPWSHTVLLSFHRSMQFVWFLTHSCQVCIDPCNLCGSSWPGSPSDLLTIFLRSSSQNHSVSRIPFGWHARCGGVLMMSCLLSISTVSPHLDRMNTDIHSEAVIEQVWTFHSDAIIEGVWRFTWRQ